MGREWYQVCGRELWSDKLTRSRIFPSRHKSRWRPKSVSVNQFWSTPIGSMEQRYDPRCPGHKSTVVNVHRSIRPLVGWCCRLAGLWWSNPAQPTQYSARLTNWLLPSVAGWGSGLDPEMPVVIKISHDLVSSIRYELYNSLTCSRVRTELRCERAGLDWSGLVQGGPGRYRLV